MRTSGFIDKKGQPFQTEHGQYMDTSHLVDFGSDCHVDEGLPHQKFGLWFKNIRSV
jgi:hypothetical protein